MPSPRKHVYNIGDKVGLLTVTGFTLIKRPDGRNRRVIDVTCVCGTTKKVMPTNLSTGDTRSCGCLHRKLASKANTTHGARAQSTTPNQRRLLSIWRGMKSRCGNPNARNYKWYGGKGISIAWSSFSDFHTWAINNGYTESLEIDRIDPSRDYAPDNCMWCSKSDNIARAHLKINNALKVKTTELAKSSNRSFTDIVELALVNFLDGGLVVIGNAN